MKLRFPTTLLLILGLLSSLVPASAAHHDIEETELSEHMEVIGKTFRTLRRAVRDPAKNAEAAMMVDTMLEAARASVSLEPFWKADQPADQQEQFVADFQSEMEKFVAMLSDLKAALEANENDKVAELVDALRDFNRASHKSFKKPDEE